MSVFYFCFFLLVFSFSNQNPTPYIYRFTTGLSFRFIQISSRDFQEEIGFLSPLQLSAYISGDDKNRTSSEIFAYFKNVSITRSGFKFTELPAARREDRCSSTNLHESVRGVCQPFSRFFSSVDVLDFSLRHKLGKLLTPVRGSAPFLRQPRDEIICPCKDLVPFPSVLSSIFLKLIISIPSILTSFIRFTAVLLSDR